MGLVYQMVHSKCSELDNMDMLHHNSMKSGSTGLQEVYLLIHKQHFSVLFGNFRTWLG